MKWKQKMLNQKICRQCVEQSIPSFANFAWQVWESRWDEGIACCLGGVDVTSKAVDLEVKQEPPDFCPFVLEHVLENENATS